MHCPLFIAFIDIYLRIHSTICQKFRLKSFDKFIVGVGRRLQARPNISNFLLSNLTFPAQAAAFIGDESTA